jgi:hypothetical protein
LVLALALAKVVVVRVVGSLPRQWKSIQKPLKSSNLVLSSQTKAKPRPLTLLLKPLAAAAEVDVIAAAQNQIIDPANLLLTQWR